MSSSKFIARLAGPVLVVSAAAMLLNGNAYRAIVDEFVQSPALIYMAGFLGLVAGLAIVNVHNSWVWGWPVIITIIGWLGVIGGVIRMMAPQFIETLGAELYDRPGFVTTSAIVVLVLGGFVSFKGYSA